VVRFDREEKRPLKPETVEKLWRMLRLRIARADAVIVSDYAKGLIDQRLMERLVAACRQKGKIVAVDPKPENAGLYKGVTVLTPNTAEAGKLAGIEIESEPGLERAGRAIIEKLDCGAVLVTRGEKGMSLFQPGRKTVHEPARAREVFDVTGAGDTVIAVFTAALATGADMAVAMRAANLAGAVVVAKVGTSTASVPEIRAMARSLGLR
jgi:D-beta-D-heptose 7-phosphate kinase/D-beta-D-heptose 1-phosphate adenosyltransferase